MTATSMGAGAGVDVPGSGLMDQAHQGVESHLRRLALLSSLMIGMDEPGILSLAHSAVPELASVGNPLIHVDDFGWWPSTEGAGRPLLEDIVSGGSDGLVRSNGDRLIALPVNGPSGPIGHLAVEVPSSHDLSSTLFPLQVFCQHLGSALENARRHAREEQLTADLRHAVAEAGALLEMQKQLNLVAALHGDVHSVVKVVSELTQCAVAVEDHTGAIVASAGGWTQDLRRRSPAARSRLVDRLRTDVRAVRDGDQLVVLAEGESGGHVFLALADADKSATAIHERVLEFAATVLAVIYAKSTVVAEAEMRLRRDLLEELLLGMAQPVAEARAEALGVDLTRTRRVVVVNDMNPGKNPKINDRLLHVVQRELKSQGDPGLAVARAAGVVCLAHDDVDWNAIVSVVHAERGGSGYRVGLGSICRSARDYPASLRHAHQSVRFTQQNQGRRVVSFDDLGVYRLLALNADTTDLDGFIDQWLGSLIEYDATRSADLVKTLSSYLRTGGSLAATASELYVHRSTVKYRLERVRTITKHDLADPETQFSLQLATYALEIRRTLRDDVNAPTMTLVSG